jgi:hypothetical protein
MERAAPLLSVVVEALVLSELDAPVLISNELSLLWATSNPPQFKTPHLPTVHRFRQFGAVGSPLMPGAKIGSRTAACPIISDLAQMGKFMGKARSFVGSKVA